MKILRKLEVPTGHIVVVEGDKGSLELVSIGDYGKDANLKADFLGLEREINHVDHQEMLPLTEKWVVTVSTQYGCSMDCKFCDVPKVGPGKNATTTDLINQVNAGLSLHPEITWSDRLNIHYARMGEPTWNLSVLESAHILYHLYNDKFNLHPVVSTMMPKKNKYLQSFIREWLLIKSGLYNGNAGLQLSINSTSDEEREFMFSGNSCSLESISNIMSNVIAGIGGKIKGRKITLNFAVADYEIDAEKLASLFDPKYFLVKLTPMHKTAACLGNGIETDGDYTTFYPYQEHEANLKAAGFDVLVFIASKEEDLGRITCGNAILSGSLPEVEYNECEV